MHIINMMLAKIIILLDWIILATYIFYWAKKRLVYWCCIIFFGVCCNVWVYYIGEMTELHESWYSKETLQWPNNISYTVKLWRLHMWPNVSCLHNFIDQNELRSRINLMLANISISFIVKNYRKEDSTFRWIIWTKIEAAKKWSSCFYEYNISLQ